MLEFSVLSCAKVLESIKIVNLIFNNSIVKSVQIFKTSSYLNTYEDSVTNT